MAQRVAGEATVRQARRAAVVILLVALAILAAVVASPRHYEVEGHSMGPALRPGDVVATAWLPVLDRWRRPERFERWVIALPDGTLGLKRVVGLPGETVALADGDLRLGAATVVVPPGVLAQRALPVAAQAPAAGDATAWSRDAGVVVDDDPEEPDGPPRLLRPVRDSGFSAVVDAGARGGSRVRAVVGRCAVTWRLTAPGSHAIVAGRLDGHVVAAAWPIPPHAPWPSRSCLPPAPPLRWDVLRPWPDTPAAASAPDELPPSLGLSVAGDHWENVGVRRVVVWRDVLHVAGLAQACWSLADEEFVVLGDRPAVSRDSRHFGPLPRSSLRQRLHGPVAP